MLQRLIMMWKDTAVLSIMPEFTWKVSGKSEIKNI
jgi:hypothetical protein